MHNGMLLTFVTVKFWFSMAFHCPTNACGVCFIFSLFQYFLWKRVTFYFAYTRYKETHIQVTSHTIDEFTRLMPRVHFPSQILWNPGQLVRLPTPCCRSVILTLSTELPLWFCLLFIWPLTKIRKNDGFWVTVCKTVRPMLSDSCLSCPVCLSCLWRWCIVAKRLDGSR